jgi:hypothetical protein
MQDYIDKYGDREWNKRDAISIAAYL